MLRRKRRNSIKKKGMYDFNYNESYKRKMKVKKKIALLALLCIFLFFFFIGWLIFNYEHFNPYFIEYVASYFLIGFFVFFYIKEGNLLSLQVMFNVYGILYTNFYIGQLIMGNQIISQTVWFAMLISHISIYSFNLFFILSNDKKKVVLKPKKYESFSYYSEKKIGLYMFFFLMLSFMAEYFVIFVRIGLTNYFSSSRATKSLLSSEYSILSFYKFTIPVIACVYLFLLLKYKKKIYMFLFIIASLGGIFNAYISSSRTEMLALVLPIICMLYYFDKINNKQLVIAGIAGIILFGTWKALLSDGRFSISFDSEFNSWYEICEDVLSNEFDYQFGKSYLDTLLNLIIPKTNREALSVWYMKTYKAAIYAKGGGRGFSGVLEAYMNFGIMGNIIIYGFYGWLIKRMKRDTDLQVILYVTLMTSAHQFFRSESYSLWKNMMWFKIYPLLVILLLSAMRKGREAKKDVKFKEKYHLSSEL